MPQWTTEAFCRFPEIDRESAEGGMISKERFLTQSDPDILRKLQNRHMDQIILDNLLQLAQTFYQGREEEEKRQKKQGRLKSQQQLSDPLWNSQRKTPTGTQAERNGLVVTEESGDTCESCSRAAKPPLSPCPVCRRPHWRTLLSEA